MQQAFYKHAFWIVFSGEQNQACAIESNIFLDVNRDVPLLRESFLYGLLHTRMADGAGLVEMPEKEEESIQWQLGFTGYGRIIWWGALLYFHHHFCLFWTFPLTLRYHIPTGQLLYRMFMLNGNILKGHKKRKCHEDKVNTTATPTVWEQYERTQTIIRKKSPSLEILRGNREEGKKVFIVQECANHPRNQEALVTRAKKYSSDTKRRRYYLRLMRCWMGQWAPHDVVFGCDASALGHNAPKSGGDIFHRGVLSLLLTLTKTPQQKQVRHTYTYRAADRLIWVDTHIEHERRSSMDRKHVRKEWQVP